MNLKLSQWDNGLLLKFIINDSKNQIFDLSEATSVIANIQRSDIQIEKECNISISPRRGLAYCLLLSEDLAIGDEAYIITLTVLLSNNQKFTCPQQFKFDIVGNDIRPETINSY